MRDPSADVASPARAPQPSAMSVGREDLARPVHRARTAEPPHQALDVAIAVGRQVLADDVLEMSASLAFRWFLAIFPFLAFVASLGGFIASALDIANPARKLVDLAGTSLPPELASVVR